MSTPWIKIEHTTPDKPEVIRMSELLKIDPDSVVGKLLRVWIWADANSVPGDKVTVTEKFIDRITHSKRFAQAMRAVGWLTGEDGALQFSNFDRHNGNSAKARAETAKRVEKHRAGNAASVTDVTPPPLQKPLPEKEIEGDRGESERAGVPEAADSSLTLADWAERIVKCYTLKDGLSQNMKEMRDYLIRTDDDPVTVYNLVAKCNRIIAEKAPQGHGTRGVPTARAFFQNEQWRSPEIFENRWSTGHGFGPQPVNGTTLRQQAATLAAKQSRGGIALPGADAWENEQ